MISIIGAGPIGNFAAYLLSKEGFEVAVFEEHEEIGLPVQCTGITTSLLKELIPLRKDCIINEVNKVHIFSPNNRFIELNLKESDIILDRHIFDNYIADLAKENSAKFFLSHRYIGNKKDKLIVRDKITNDVKEFNFDSLIGADGPLSAVAKHNNLFRNREFWQGIQARVKLENENIVEFYPYFGTYAWVVPESESIARIGLVSQKYARTLFHNFLFKFKNIKKDDVIELQSGLIPKYDPSIKTQRNNIYIVGDAACQVKATTGGGIIPGLKAAKSLVDSINGNKSYNRDWRNKIGKELYFHYQARKIMDRFKRKDWDKLVKIMSSNEAKEILEKEKRDNLANMLLRFLIKKPGLLYFLKYLV
jgi:geranylgeranyl reductase family protein